jgi:hypothetical protein
VFTFSLEQELVAAARKNNNSVRRRRRSLTPDIYVNIPESNNFTAPRIKPQKFTFPLQNDSHATKYVGLFST